MSAKTILIVFSFLCFYETKLYSQEQIFPPEKDKVGTLFYEGIRNYSNVNAGQIKLRSFLAKNKQAQSPIIGPFNFSFDLVLEHSENMDVFIEDNLDISYYLMPIQKRWKSGKNIFTWDGDFATKQGIKINDLYGVATYDIPGISHKIVPLTFYQSKTDNPDFYEFVFIATKDMNFRFTIFDSEENEIYQEQIVNCRKNTDINFKWYFKDAKYGVYLLQVAFARAAMGIIIIK